MKRTKFIIRIAFFLLTISLLVYLNVKTDGQAETIAEFKFKMIQKINADSLNSKHKAELVLNETTKFIDDSSRVRKGMQYLMGLLGLWAVIEVCFLILRQRNYTQPDSK